MDYYLQIIYVRLFYWDCGKRICMIKCHFDVGCNERIEDPYMAIATALTIKSGRVDEALKVDLCCASFN